MNDLQKKFVGYLAEVQQFRVENCMASHKCEDEKIKQMLYEVTYDMAVSIMELIDGYSGYSSDKHDIINTVTGERLKENPFIELHDVLDGKLKN
jgi:hypothetical protein